MRQSPFCLKIKKLLYRFQWTAKSTAAGEQSNHTVVGIVLHTENAVHLAGGRYHISSIEFDKLHFWILYLLFLFHDSMDTLNKSGFRQKKAGIYGFFLPKSTLISVFLTLLIS